MLKQQPLRGGSGDPRGALGAAAALPGQRGAGAGGDAAEMLRGAEPGPAGGGVLPRPGRARNAAAGEGRLAHIALRQDRQPQWSAQPWANWVMHAWTQARSLAESVLCSVCSGSGKAEEDEEMI